ncbi:MAG: c-type cytochrome [Actinobacteria bacterium]|nr:c-type cytochrome [Actinomycetota bacterium]
MGRLWRPLLVGAVVAAATFALAQMAVFEPTAPPAATLAGGDVYRGQLTFERACASCHGPQGEGGSPGPPLVDSGLDAVEVAATVELGRGVMPPALVSGQEQADVVAYVVSISSR